MPDDQQTPPGGDPIDDAIDASDDSTPASVALSAADVRNTPEYKALLRQNRKLARDHGSAQAALAAARTEAENARLAAEATQQAALEQEIAAALGEEGVAFWDEFAELSASDPRAAARRLAEVLNQSRAQSAAAGATPTDDANPAAGGGNVPAQTPPPPSRGVDGGSPLGAATTGEDTTAVVTALEKQYGDVVSRVQDPVTRNRVTMKDRAAGFISYLGASYVKALGNAPRDRR